MGSCLSLNCASCDMLCGNNFHGRQGYKSNVKNDLDGITFSHYSLTSETSFLDLYPALKFMENDQSSNSVMTNGSCCAEYDHWRHSGIPLIDDDNVDERCSLSFHCEHNSSLCNPQISNQARTRVCESNINQNVSELKILEVNGPNTSSIMNGHNDLPGIYPEASKNVYNASKDALSKDIMSEMGVTDDSLKEKLNCDFLSPSTIEESIEEKLQLHPRLTEESSFGYTNLENHAKTINSKSPLAARFPFSHRLRIRHSMTPNQRNTENTRLNIFRRRNTIQDHISNENG